MTTPPDCVNDIYAFVVSQDPFLPADDSYPPYERGTDASAWVTKSDGVTPALAYVCMSLFSLVVFPLFFVFFIILEQLCWSHKQ